MLKLLYYNDLVTSNKVVSKNCTLSFFIYYLIITIIYLLLYTYYLTIIILNYYNINEL